MPEFQLNAGRDFGQLDAFTQGYIEALFFTETNEMYARDEWDSPRVQDDIREGRVSGEIPLDSSTDDLAPDAMADIVSDCARFQAINSILLSSAYKRDYTPTQAGRDYWYSRNGHGVGFWSRSELEDDGLGDRLSAAAGRSESYVYWHGGQVHVA